jgi:ribosome maturation protein SDO1
MADVNIDPFVDAEVQIEKVLKSIKPILPIKFEKLLLQLKIPPQFAGKAYSVITKACEVKSEEYLGDGSLQVQIEIFSGVQDEFFRKIAEITKGNYESKVLKKVEV